METELPFPPTSLTGDPGGHLRAAAPETRERTFERHLEDVAEIDVQGCRPERPSRDAHR